MKKSHIWHSSSKQYCENPIGKILVIEAVQKKLWPLMQFRTSSRA